jgi:hypothetical protein
MAHRAAVGTIRAGAHKFIEEALAKARERIAQRLANLGKPVEPPKPVTVNARGRPRRHSVLKIFS